MSKLGEMGELGVMGELGGDVQEAHNMRAESSASQQALSLRLDKHKQAKMLKLDLLSIRAQTNIISASGKDLSKNWNLRTADLHPPS